MKKLKEILLTIVLVFLLLISALWTLIKTPWHYISYKRSPFYRDFKRKYRMFICTNADYRMYNLIKEKNLPVRFVTANAADPLANCFFVYKKTLILHDLTQISYRSDVNKWVFRLSKDASEKPIFEHAVESVKAVQALPGCENVQNMLLLLSRSQILKTDRERAEKDMRFLLHNGKDMADLLDAYIVTHPKG